MKKALFFLLCMCMCIRSACAISLENAAERSPGSRIGILSAMENEVKLLLSQAEIERIDTIGGVDFHVGTLCGRDVVIAKAGIGKVLSASGASAMLCRFPISFLIFTGIAGGVGDETNVLDITIATELVQHDYGMQTKDGFVWTPSRSGIEGYYFCDEELVNAAYRASVEVVGKEHTFKGLIATGDQFIASEFYVRYSSGVLRRPRL